jgi:hypothetical protein
VHRRTWMAPALLVIAGGLGLWLWKGSVSASSEPAAAVRPASTAPSASASSTAPARSSPATKPAPVLVKAVEGGVAITADQAIANVHGVAITGRHLLAFSAEPEQTMTRQMFEHLRRRAIDRELTFQAARARGIELSAAQLAELEQVRRNAIERGISDTAQLDLEVAEARAGLLQTALLETAVVAPTDADLDRIASESGPLPQDPAALGAARMQARQKLADDTQAQYATRLRAYLDDLADKAGVE